MRSVIWRHLSKFASGQLLNTREPIDIDLCQNQQLLHTKITQHFNNYFVAIHTITSAFNLLVLPVPTLYTPYGLPGSCDPVPHSTLIMSHHRRDKRMRWSHAAYVMYYSPRYENPEPCTWIQRQQPPWSALYHNALYAVDGSRHVIFTPAAIYLQSQWRTEVINWWSKTSTFGGCWEITLILATFLCERCVWQRIIPIPLMSTNLQERVQAWLNITHTTHITLGSWFSISSWGTHNLFSTRAEHAGSCRSDDGHGAIGTLAGAAPDLPARGINVGPAGARQIRKMRALVHMGARLRCKNASAWPAL